MQSVEQKNKESEAQFHDPRAISLDKNTEELKQTTLKNVFHVSDDKAKQFLCVEDPTPQAQSTNVSALTKPKELNSILSQESEALEYQAIQKWLKMLTGAEIIITSTKKCLHLEEKKNILANSSGQISQISTSVDDETKSSSQQSVDENQLSETKGSSNRGLKKHIPSFDSRSQGTVMGMIGDIYERIILSLILQVGRKQQAKFQFIRAKESISFQRKQNFKEADLIFKTKSVFDLQKLKTLFIGPKIIFLGKLNSNCCLEQCDNYTIDDDSLVIIEAKKSSEELQKAWDQISKIFGTFLEWIDVISKENIKDPKSLGPSFFKFDSDKDLNKWILQNSVISVNLIIITNGDSPNIPSSRYPQYQGEVAKYLKGADFGSKIKLSVVFMYIPTYVEDKFLISFYQEQIVIREATLKAELLKEWAEDEKRRSELQRAEQLKEWAEVEKRRSELQRAELLKEWAQNEKRRSELQRSEMLMLLLALLLFGGIYSFVKLISTK